MAFRSREQLFIPPERWQAQRGIHFRRLRLPTDATLFLDPIVARARAGVPTGTLRVDDELLITPFAVDEEDPELAGLR